MSKNIAFILLLLTLTGCSGTPELEIPEEVAALENLTVYSVDTPAQRTLTLQKTVTFGDTDEVLIGTLAGMAADNDGNVYLADRDENVIHMFDPDGGFLKSIGGSGSGPGEFRSVIAPSVKDDFLYAIDFSQQRLSAFNLDDHSFAYTIDIGAGVTGFPNTYYPLSDGSYLVLTTISNRDDTDPGMQTGSFILNSDGEVISENLYDFKSHEVFVIQTDRATMWTSLPFNHRFYVSVAANDEVYYAYTDRALIKVYDTEGNLLRAIYYPYQNVSVTRQQLLDSIENEVIRREARRSDLPETLPAFSRMAVDDENRIWMAMIHDNEETHNWWVLSENGEKIASFTWPADTEFQLVKNGNIYFQETDEETGLHQVVRYRIEIGD